MTARISQKTQHPWLAALLFVAACGPDESARIRDTESAGREANAAEQTARATGTFSLLTYNIAGLPEPFSSSKPKPNTPLIGSLLNGYDVVLVQEDFWYHAELLETDRHAYRSAPYREDRSLVDLGDGLNMLSALPFSRFERFTYGECHGTVTCDNDCLAEKGYDFAVLTPEDGVVIHVYNTHLDSGECDKDKVVRWQQLMELMDTVEVLSAGEAVIIAGDTNLEADTPEDMDSLAAFTARLGVQDVCRAMSCGYETIDRVFVRSSKSVQLTPTEWRRPTEFVDASGAALSDHVPVLARIEWTAQAASH